MARLDFYTEWFGYDASSLCIANAVHAADQFPDTNTSCLSVALHRFAENLRQNAVCKARLKQAVRAERLLLFNIIATAAMATQITLTQLAFLPAVGLHANSEQNGHLLLLLQAVLQYWELSETWQPKRCAAAPAFCALVLAPINSVTKTARQQQPKVDAAAGRSHCCCVLQMKPMKQ